MRKAPVFFLDVPFEERLNYITATYGGHKKEDLVNAIMRIRKRLGGLNAKNAISYLVEDNVKEAFRILLAYYDKYYKQSLGNRDNLEHLLTTVPCMTTDAAENIKAIIQRIPAEISSL